MSQKDCKPTEKLQTCVENIMVEKQSCALVINNLFNDQTKGCEYLRCCRQGAEGDTEKARQLFNDLKFAFVQAKENVSSDQLPEIFEEFRKVAKELDCSACFIIIMRHAGEEPDSIVMNDLQEVDLYKDIVYKFSDHDDVKGRQKVFLVQACRESRDLILEDSRPHPAAVKRLQDILIGHSTIPDHPAGRHVENGTLYFDVINKVLRKNAENSSFKAMLHEVYYKLLREHGQRTQVQDLGFQDYKFKL